MLMNAKWNYCFVATWNTNWGSLGHLFYQFLIHRLKDFQSFLVLEESPMIFVMCVFRDSFKSDIIFHKKKIFLNRIRGSILVITRLLLKKIPYRVRGNAFEKNKNQFYLCQQKRDSNPRCILRFWNEGPW